jgi:hypothetical protein
MAKADITRTPEEIKAVFAAAAPDGSLLPDLVAAAENPEAARSRPSLDLVREDTRELLADIETIPALTYTKYRDVQRLDQRRIYQIPHFEKRGKMAVAALQVLLGHDEYLNTLYDYIWSTCEETGWVLPQVEHLGIELRAVSTAMDLAEIVEGLGDRLEERLIDRIRQEIETRIFTPYLEDPDSYWWYKGYNNWNGVCNGAVGTAFLLLEEDDDRLARAVATVLEGLETFLNVAFTEDGGSEEGPGYWQYGMSNLIAFSEALRQRTGGEIDLLATERVREIAAYPPKVMLSPGHYFSYSDSSEESAFHPGLVQRLAERSGVEEVLDILAAPGGLQAGSRRFHEMWRALMWWDGTRPDAVEVGDAVLPATEVVRLTGATPDGAPVVVAAKASHNAASHNQNDVGVFVLHVDGETFICDPERGAYSVAYFGENRYQNPFANSYGHSVPRIGGQLQSAGAEYAGEFTAIELDGDEKRAEMQIGGAYDVAELVDLNRTLALTPEGDVIIEDAFTVSGAPPAVEEAFVTWRNAMISGNTALIVGENHVLELTIESPGEAAFELEVLEEASERNRKPVPLKRLSFAFPPEADETVARVRARILP